MDGNCLYHVVADQSHFLDHREARRTIVENVLPLVENGSIFWNDDIYMLDWIETQEQETKHGDVYSLQIAANILQRDLIIVPTQQNSAHNPLGYILIGSLACVNEPVFFFVF